LAADTQREVTIHTLDDCIICRKHARPELYIGNFIAELGGLKLGHFPFLPDEKATRGHLILEPQRHITQLEDMNDSEAAALGVLTRAGVQMLKSELGAEHVYILRINDKVAHLHFHLVPRYPGTPREHWGPQIMNWPDRPIVDLPRIKEISLRLHEIAMKLLS